MKREIFYALALAAISVSLAISSWYPGPFWSGDNFFYLLCARGDLTYGIQRIGYILLAKYLGVTGLKIVSLFSYFWIIAGTWILAKRSVKNPCLAAGLVASTALIYKFSSVELTDVPATAFFILALVVPEGWGYLVALVGGSIRESVIFAAARKWYIALPLFCLAAYFAGVYWPGSPGVFRDAIESLGAIKYVSMVFLFCGLIGLPKRYWFSAILILLMCWFAPAADGRYLMPLIPLICIGFVNLFEKIKYLHFVIIGLIVFNTLNYGMNLTPPGISDLNKLAEWTKHNTPENIYLSVRKPYNFWYLSGRRCEYAQRQDRFNLHEYVVIDPTYADDFPIVAAWCYKWKIIHREGEAYLLHNPRFRKR